jgi:hypothetical protein
MLKSFEYMTLAPHALAGNLLAVSKWDARSEVPDTVAFADLLCFSADVTSEWSRRFEPDPVGHFPYPKRSGGLRQISMLSVGDLVRLRTAVGDIARVTNGVLRPSIYSAKLRREPPVWYFKNNLYAAFQQAALRLCRYWESDGMVRTDVQAYYPNIQLETLLRSLWDSGCDRETVRCVVQTLMRWQDRDRLSGIPIGPEACAVLGAFYLREFDDMIAPLTTGYFRYSDDIIYFFKEGALTDAGLATVREWMLTVRLRMNEEKTRVFYSPEEAAEAIRRSLLDYVDSQFQGAQDDDLSVVRDLFDEEIADTPSPDAVTYAWCINRLMRPTIADEHALPSILERPELMSLDPRMTGQYLTRCARGNSDATSVMAARLPAIKDDPAASLHTLRYLSASVLNKSQALVALDIANASDALPPVRVWALEAQSRSPKFDARLVPDLINEHTPQSVRRSAALSLRHLAGHRGRRFVARELAAKYPDIRWSAWWAAEIAA